ncbi:ankyrin repeat domain-containing protein [Legionella shakespearei]|uniref:Ankyrin n=1 Tax=Legionella shakespearei DSM 23087 TaxID=1122169 RepID=A0A0W0YVQ2_9GAMM|nr:ankyrin repeat domain-containing protein [Legionella shakespearei]KTD60936.1 ankyrin [Legionella shakespearei DSM 23087]
MKDENKTLLITHEEMQIVSLALLMAHEQGSTAKLLDVLKHFIDEEVERKIKKDLLEAYEQNDTEKLVSILDKPECTKEILLQELKHDSTLLTLAARKGRTNIVKAILDHKKCTHEVFLHQDKWGGSALNQATLCDHPETVSVILNHPKCTREALTQTCHEGEIPLHIAAKRAYTDIVLMLLDSPLCLDEDLLQEDHEGYTPMTQVSSRGHRNSHKDHRITLRAIINHAKCTKEILYQSSALLVAVADENLAAAQIILADEKCTPEMVTKTWGQEDKNILMLTLYHRPKNEMLSFLLNHPKFDKKLLLQENDQGYNVLMLAAWAEPLEVPLDTFARLLNSPLCNEEILSAQNDSGYTALMLAVLNYRKDKVLALLNSPHCTDAVIQMTTPDGKRADQLSPRHRDITLLIKIVPMLRQIWDCSASDSTNLIHLMNTFCETNSSLSSYFFSEDKTLTSVRFLIKQYKENGCTSHLSLMSELKELVNDSSDYKSTMEITLSCYIEFIESQLAVNQVPNEDHSEEDEKAYLLGY